MYTCMYAGKRKTKPKDSTDNGKKHSHTQTHMYICMYAGKRKTKSIDSTDKGK